MMRCVTHMQSSNMGCRWVCTCGRASAWSDAEFHVVADEATVHSMEMSKARHPSSGGVLRGVQSKKG